MTEKKNKPFQVLLTPSQHAEFMQTSDQRGDIPSELAREWIDEYVSRDTSGLQFKDTGHRERFEMWAWPDPDRYSVAALFVLSAIGKEEPLGKCIKPRLRSIDFERIKETGQNWSNGEKAMVNLAACLFNGHIHDTPLDAALSPLDQEHMAIALQGIRIRYE